MREKYGVDHYFQTEEFKEKNKNNNLEKYGKEWYMQTDEYKEKVKITNKEKYGKEWYMQTDEFREKSKATNLVKYGKEWYTQTEQYKLITQSKIAQTVLKTKQTNLERYGFESYSQTQEYLLNKKITTPNIDAMIATNLERYGKEWYAQSEEGKLRVINTCRLKFGADSVFGSKYFKDNFHAKSLIESKKALFEKSKLFYSNLGIELLESENYVVKLKGQCGHTYDINTDLFYHRNAANIETCMTCNPLHRRSSSQDEINKWLNDLGVNTIPGDRTICSPYEIDIVVEGKNIGLEYNGLYWHSEINKNDKNYHKRKTDICNSKSFDLIHIREDDWVYKNDIIKSIILNRLNLIDNSIYARKCEIKMVDFATKSEFLDNNHIQGKCGSKINIGLYHDETLVSLMCFGNKEKTPLTFELLRFCNKINTNVIGAASKLFNHFKLNFEYDTIFSFSDNSIFNGDLYKKLDFEFSHETEPNYWWVVDGIRKHRFNFNKGKLVKKGYDPNKSEREIMTELGYYKIWGCGLKKWIYKNN